tara:strand:- start:2064 stop:2309 length:246 start_codon:yes stop_codon:yes gene_type:complete
MMNHNIETAIVEVPVCVPAPKPEGRTMIQHVGVVGIVVFLVSAIVASFWLIGKGLTKEQLAEQAEQEAKPKRRTRKRSSAK